MGNPPEPPRRRLALTLLALLALGLGGGNHAWAPAVFAGPCLLLLLVRGHGARLGYGVFLLGVTLQWLPSLGPLGGPLILLGAPVYAGAAFVPYLLDRRLAPPGTGGLTGTLAFPLTWVGLEAALSIPLANVSTPAIPLADLSVVLQLAALGGAFAVTFVVAWTARLAVAALEARSRPGLVARPACALALLWCVVLGWGAWRLRAPERPSLPVACVSWDGAAPELGSLVRASAGALADGARVVVWAEVSARVTEDELATLVDEAQQVTARHGGALVLALGVQRPGDDRLDNRVLVVDARGELASYRKTFLAPGEGSIPGSGDLPRVVFPWGTLSSAICADLSDHRLLRRASGMSLVCEPAAEWPGIDPTNSRIARVRAVENGFALAKSTRGGRSLLADSRGAVVAVAPVTSGGLRVLRGEVPLGGETTPYSRLGDVPAWACLLVVAGWVLGSWRASRGSLAQADSPA